MSKRTSRRHRKPTHYADQYPGEDWRIGAMAKPSQNVKAAYPGGPSHQAGSTIYRMNILRNSAGEYIGFTDHNPVGLALHLAESAARNAVSQFQKIEYESMSFPTADSKMLAGKTVKKSSTSILYDYFENCMTAVTFSYQAIETFANLIIAEKYKRIFFERRYFFIKKYYTLEQMQRKFSTSEKIFSILPTLSSQKFDKGDTAFREFSMLRQKRDATIHLKKHGDYGIKGVDESSLFWHFFNANPMDYPRTAVDVIDYIVNKIQYTARWFEIAKDNILKE